jgi:hypothetical protein
MADSPRIDVACLSAYSRGMLYGEWLDADQISRGTPPILGSQAMSSPPSATEQRTCFGTADGTLTHRPC